MLAGRHSAALASHRPTSPRPQRPSGCRNGHHSPPTCALQQCCGLRRMRAYAPAVVARFTEVPAAAI
ncbi:hypothetical protein GUJ93_ZPchr0012g21575 [Zizania palustris]|uniref:Uncharacterized protein n=1 Tax=Zizania palustris TaxID=103762 RepID=A0A8J6BXJ0_ZIZPA|nr:hypothetical protein GUJ93_ZPchr0012g21575 [Zizania palustris]